MPSSPGCRGCSLMPSNRLFLVFELNLAFIVILIKINGRVGLNQGTPP